MAEDDNQDMAMEDILSSIKNILEEDEAGKTAAPAPAAEPLVDEQAEVDVDDILELSPDMQIEEAPSAVVEPAVPEEINLEAELDAVPAPELNSELNAVPASELNSETNFEINDSEVAGEQGVQANVGLGWEDFESDPFDAEGKTAPAADELPEEVAPAGLPEIAVEEEPAVVAEPVAEPEPFVASEPFVEAVPEPEPFAEAEAVPVPEPYVEAEVAPEPVNAAPEPKPAPVAAEPAADAVDVSANIISNFAKMFSQAEPQPQSAPADAVPAEPVKLVGDGSKTIEDVVADVIRRIIGVEVEQNWRAQADYDTFARQVIAEQTKAWLDANLPAVVETIVKQEIERVMAKVGNNQ